ncbi:hypothetical protein D3C86_1160350 [compost metagenome]
MNVREQVTVNQLQDIFFRLPKRTDIVEDWHQERRPECITLLTLVIDMYDIRCFVRHSSVLSFNLLLPALYRTILVPLNRQGRHVNWEVPVNSRHPAETLHCNPRWHGIGVTCP